MFDFRKTDPEFAERLEHFVFEEVVQEPGQELDPVTRHLAILATLLGCQGIDAFREELPEALDAGVSPVMAKEVIYQAVDYLGIGRVLPFLHTANQILEHRGVNLPLEGQATTTMEDRLEKGAQAQAEIFGPQMLEAWKQGHINRWLADNCFGDYYTRSGLDLAQREMITFCYLAAQGGCEPQLIAHAKGNRNLGNDQEFLIRVVSQCLPYIGYPRSLNAITCIHKAAENNA
ncbi:MAG: carboxymuconolactone decarboxylase family protein [Acutalibacter sp.]|jgi:4-carboxymuconolactone decarboxylase